MTAKSSHGEYREKLCVVQKARDQLQLENDAQDATLRIRKTEMQREQLRTVTLQRQLEKSEEAMDSLRKDTREELDQATKHQTKAADEMRDRHAGMLKSAADQSTDFLAQVDSLTDKNRQLQTECNKLNRSVRQLDSDKRHIQSLLDEAKEHEQKAERSCTRFKHRCDELDKTLRRLEEENASFQRQVSEAHEEKDMDGREFTTKLASREQLLGQLVKSLSGTSLDSSSVQLMIECHTRAAKQRLIVFSNPKSELQLAMPRMFFAQDIASSDPVTNAITFWASTLTAQFSFGDSQALFNAATFSTESVSVYPWVLDALEIVTDSIPSRTMDLMSLKKALTVLQGIAYFFIILQGMEEPQDNVRQLRDKVQENFQDKGFLIGESTLAMVLKKFSALIDGSPITSWIEAPSSENEAARRLDGSNSGIGSEQCLIADPSVNSFTLINGINTAEALYAFDNEDVGGINVNDNTEYVLRFAEAHVSRLPASSILLGSAVREASADDWVFSFLTEKLWL